MNTTTTTDLTRQAILLKAASIVEQGWCQGVNHRNREGISCCREEAIESCAEGAIVRAFHHLSEDHSDADLTVLTSVPLVLGKYLGKASIPAWNDHPGRTADEVAEAMRQAAKSTRT